jgi:hypothetical protein
MWVIFSGPEDIKNTCRRMMLTGVLDGGFTVYVQNISLLTGVFSLSVLSNFRIRIKLTSLFYFQNTSGLVVCFFVGFSPASEFYMPYSEYNTLSSG